MEQEDKKETENFAAIDRDPIEDKFFVNDLSNLKFLNRRFTRTVAKNRKFSRVDFSYSTFDACYFRDCEFQKCNFTGCRIVNANLHGSTFTGCKFEYTYFEKTLIDPSILSTNCPGYENQKMRFARALRINFQQLGDSIAVNKAINVELEAHKTHLKKAWQSSESYYRAKYSGWSRFVEFIKWLGFITLDVVWGNGESLSKLFRTFIALMLSIAILQTFIFVDTQSSSPNLLSGFLQAPVIFFDTRAFSYLPDYYTTSVMIIRLVLFAMFMSVLIKRTSRR